MIQDIQKLEYGRSLSTVFGAVEKSVAISEEDDDDPILEDLRILDYRYIRFSYNPLTDKFVLTNSWTDPAWTDVKTIRAGIDADEKEIRELVVGKNMIDIKQKSIPELLLDEVCEIVPFKFPILISPGFPSFLRIPIRQSSVVVN
jgi:cation-transporting ATPase 13A2